MIWRELVINYRPNAQELAFALAEIFKIDKERIDITDALENAKSDSSVICVISGLSGYFCSMLSFYLDFTIDNEMLIVAQISAILNCEVLISNDNNVNPYSMLLVNQEGKLGEVKVDPDKLDEDEEYEIINYRRC